MIKNYYLILNIIKHLHAKTCRKKITKVYTQNKNEIVFACSDFSILIHLDSTLPYIIYSESYQQKENSVMLLNTLKHEEIESVQIINNKRVVCIKTGNYDLYINLFHGKVGLSVYQSGKLIESIKSDVSETEQEEIKCDQHITHLLKNEAYVQKCDTRELIKDILKSDELYWYRNGSENHFTTVKFKSLNEYELIDKRKNILLAYENFIYRYSAYLKFTSLFENLKKHIEKQLNYLAKTKRNILNSLEDKEKQKRFEIYGHLILSHINKIKTRDTSVVLTNYFSESQESIEIPLSEILSANENAKRYYRKAKSIQQNEHEMKTRLSYIELKQKILSDLKEELQKSSRLKNLDRIKKKLISMRLIVAETNKEKRLIQQKYVNALEFKIDGYEILVGKNATSNEFVSLKAAKANDYWFHVQGSPSSHVILRWHQEKDKPPKHLIKKVASLTAHYSKQKNARTIPVVYTLAKYVRKPRGAKAGTVTIQYEKSIFVKAMKIEELNA